MHTEDQLSHTRRMTWLPPDDMNWGVIGYYVYVSDLAVDLYVQGKSLDEVADLIGRSIKEVAELTWAADVLRSTAAQGVLNERRARARAVLARSNIRALAVRWMSGVEVEALARERDVPPDLMWDALAHELSKRM